MDPALDQSQGGAPTSGDHAGHRATATGDGLPAEEGDDLEAGPELKVA